jgi:cytochrome c5
MHKILTYLLLLLSSVGNAALTAHHPLQQIARIQQSKNPGAQVYQHICQQCHAQDPPIAVGAPRFRQSPDWRARLAPGLAHMLHNLAQGMGIMPPRGGCFECSDELLKQATLHMLPLPMQKKLSTVTTNSKTVT